MQQYSEIPPTVSSTGYGKVTSKGRKFFKKFCKPSGLRVVLGSNRFKFLIIEYNFAAAEGGWSYSFKYVWAL